MGEGSGSEVTQGRVLIVDDEPTVRRGLSRLLRAAGYEVEAIGDGDSAVRRLAAGGFDVVVSDISMPGLDGIALLRSLREKELDLPVILVTGQPSKDTAIKATELGAVRYLLKPFEAEALHDAVAHAVRLRRVASRGGS
jgi:DNA-binding NtrC family response regulator